MSQDKIDQSALFTKLGELSADVKHVLLNQAESRAEVAKLREDVDTELQEVKGRLTRLESFNVKVIAIAGAMIPLIIIVLEWGIPIVMNALAN